MRPLALPDRTPAVLLATLALLVGGLQLALPADGATPVTVPVSYDVHVADPGSHRVDVILTLRGAEGVIDTFEYDTATHSYTVTNVSATGGTLTNTSRGVSLEVTSDEAAIRYTVEVNREAVGAHTHVEGTPGRGYSSFLGPDWGLVKAEALATSFRMVFDSRYEIAWDASVEFHLPEGWSAEASWERGGDGVFHLAEDEFFPRGYVALGNFTTATHEAGDRSWRYVELGPTPGFRADVFTYLEASTPYLRGVYGEATGDVVLAVSAPDPMFKGGLGAVDSLYVHESGSLEVLAHEHVHVWQRYRVEANPGTSALWILEGAADYHGPLSLVAANIWSPGDADAHLQEMVDRAERNGELDEPLVDSVYGGDLEKVAYRKGALVLQALDHLLKDGTEGRVELADVVAELNLRFSELNPDHADGNEPVPRVTNGDLRDLLVELAGQGMAGDVDGLFDAYVRGTDAPELRSVEESDALSLSGLRVVPSTTVRGEPANVTFTVENKGITTASRSLVLYVNGSAISETTVEVEPLKQRTLTLPLPLRPPGEYPVRIAYLTAVYRVVTPPDLHLVRATPAVNTPTAGEALEVLVNVENRGGASANVTVSVLVDGEPAAEAEAHVPGGLARTLSVPLTVTEPGEHVLTVRAASLQGPVGEERLTVTWLHPDSDGDGVRDDEDDYPENPRIFKRTPLSEAVNEVPGPGMAFLGLAVALALLWVRRRPG